MTDPKGYVLVSWYEVDAKQTTWSDLVPRVQVHATLEPMPYKDPAVQKQAQADWYQRNKELVDERTRSQKAVKYEHIRQLKEASPCTDCGVFYPYYVMDFDHITDDKVADIKWLVQHKGWQQVLDEIAKCELVCANCHRKRTHDRTHGVIV